MATTETATVILPRKPQGAFRNEPFTDFTTADNKRAMQDALARARAELGETYDLIKIGRAHV